jgi:RND superfamily putative drug exporter
MVLSLAPAMLTLFGRAVWWLPAWLARLLPRVDIEGESEAPPPWRHPLPSTPQRPAAPPFPTTDLAMNDAASA